MRLLTLFALLAALTAAGTAWAHDDEGRNFEARLGPAMGVEDGAGKVRFRQPRDENKIVYLYVRVRGLLPNNSYYLQRATDTVVDDVCTGTNWLTLGQGLVQAPIGSDRRGKGRALLWRDLGFLPEGTRFDIHFRVIDATTSAVILESGCHQFTVLQ
jgi:hypothetical protein